MKKNSKIRNILYTLFVLVIIGTIAYGAFLVYRNANLSVSQFTNDGYALYLSSNSVKANVASFKNGDEYAYKKRNNKVSFESNNENVIIDDDSILHYQDGGLIVLKNTVGIDLEKIDDELILYYNIFKNTEIKKDDSNGYYIDGIDKKITFKKLLLRISDNKFLLTGNNIRAVMFNDQIVDFGNYIYFEYVNGSVVKIYNRDKFYQTVSSEIKVVSDDIVINLNEKEIKKSNVSRITLSNLVIDMDSNIDVITEEAKIDKGKVSKPNIDKELLKPPVIEENGNNSNSGVINNDDNGVNNGIADGGDSESGDNGNSSENNEEEEEESNTVYYKEPVFKVTSLNVTALRLDAGIEITDDDGLLINPVVFSIVENTTAATVYEEELSDGNLSAFISYPNLKPDTEYTLYGKASYKVEDLTLEKTFLSKIFRTEALGVSFRKSYVTKDSIVIDLYKESYSKVSSVTMGIYNDAQELIDYKTIDLVDKTKTKYQVSFTELEHNKTYSVKMYDILSSGVIVDDGFSQIETIKTLKTAPKIGDLSYRVNKVDGKFELDVSKVIDEDYGIYNYRYEVFDVRQDLSKDTPILSIEQKNLGTMDVVVDDSKIYRGIAYTYRLVVEFNDNEKNIEYTKNLSTVMQLDGVEYPTLRWQETSITWEQINGTIIIDDPAGTLQSNVYKVVYKNSIDMYTVNTIVTETPQNEIPITVNYLRANETYTFDVYANINLQDGNPTASQAYIGSVNVQTKSPNRLTANFSKMTSPSDVFAISFGLTDSNENASMEASTLTSINFTLYQGTTTDGKVEVFKKEIDLNDDEYTSTLKQKFYDDSSTINADFFDADNSVFKQKTYTLVVDGAYDYTGYDTNIIPIDNNTYQFDVNNYIPSLPEPGTSQVTVKQVLNKLASSFGLEYDNELDPNTVVALNTMATYDNNSNNAKYLIYHIWVKNNETNEFEMIDELDKKVYFNDDGTLTPTVFEVSKGTADNVVDKDVIRRGNEYYISFEAYLDIDGDNIIDTIYPNSIDDTAILKSDDFKLKKQSSEFKLYPSISNANSMTWKYLCVDYDQALISNNLYGYINANSTPSSSPQISISDDYQSATFTGLSKGKTLTIKKQEKIYKTNPATYSSLTSQYFYGYQASVNLSYTVNASDNLVTFTIDDYNNKTSIIESISAIDVEVEPVNVADLDRLGTKTIKNINLKNGRITIDYFELQDYYDVEIRLKLIAYYDSGEIGYDYTSQVLALQNGSYSEPGNYYTFSGRNLTQVSSVYGNTMGLVFYPQENKLSLTNNTTGRTYDYEIAIDQTGIVYNNNNLIAKNINNSNLTSADNVIKFDFVIPGISLLDSSNKINIVPLLTGVYVNANITTFSDTIIKDDLIYFELFETNVDGTGAQYVDTLSHTVSEFSESILIDGLKHKTNYYIKVYADLFNPKTNTYEKRYLYDINQQAVECIYNFHTLSDVGIKNVKATFVANSYYDKKVRIDYELENVTGYNYISYALYKKVNGEYERVNISIPNSTNFFKNMHIEINASPSLSNELVYGGEYKITIEAFGEYTMSGESYELALGNKTTNFLIPDCEIPYVGITSGKSEDTIYFRVTINDPSHAIDNDTYSIQLLDSDNNVVASKTNISTSSINRRFEFSGAENGLINGETYKFDVIIRNDLTNTRQNLLFVHKNRSIQYGSNIDLGTVVLSENKTTEGAFDLIFSDSYRLTSISRISYSVSSINTGFYISKTGNFNVRYDDTLNLYIYTIDLSDVELDIDNVYLFTLNFYEGDNLVAEEEIDYYNGGNDGNEETP